MDTTNIKNIRIADFDYPLPDERIARHPLSQRDNCKLLVRDSNGVVEHHLFSELPGLIPAGGIMVCNDTRVINARIEFEKSTGSRIEVFMLEPLQPEDYVLMFQARKECRWSCLVGNLKRWKQGCLEKELIIDGKKVILRAERGERREGNAHDIRFSWDDHSITFASIVDAAGYIPIPPYLKRDSEAADTEDYQTIYAKVKGSVAAPTAGLHFTPSLFEEIRKTTHIVPITLHVGAGTFQPVKSEEIGDHPMHTEVFSISREALNAILDAKENCRPVTAIGTTSVRTLESLPYIGEALAAGDTNLRVSQWQPYRQENGSKRVSTIEALKTIVRYMDKNQIANLVGETSIMICPGFKWSIVDNIVTNFHQPQSTLLLLVSAFLDREDNIDIPTWRTIYNEALSKDYRFLSYGDACLFLGSHQ